MLLFYLLLKTVGIVYSFFEYLLKYPNEAVVKGQGNDIKKFKLKKKMFKTIRI